MRKIAAIASLAALGLAAAAIVVYSKPQPPPRSRAGHRSLL